MQICSGVKQFSKEYEQNITKGRQHFIARIIFTEEVRHQMKTGAKGLKDQYSAQGQPVLTAWLTFSRSAFNEIL